MKLKKGKKISSIVLAFAGCLVLFLAVGFVQFFTVRVAMAVEQDYRFEQSVADLRYILSRINDPYSEEGVDGQIWASTRIAARALADENARIWNGKTGTFKDGYILKITDEGVEYPEDFPYIETAPLTRRDFEEADRIRHESKGLYETVLYSDRDGKDVLFYRYPIRGDYYYLTFESFENFGGSDTRLEEANRTIEFVEQAYDIQVGLLDMEDMSVSEWPFEDPKDSPEKLEISMEVGNNRLVRTTQGWKWCQMAEINNLYCAVIFTDIITVKNGFRILPVILLYALFLTVFIVWGFALYRYAGTTSFTPAKREYYSPSKVKVRVIGYGILTVFLFFFATLYIDALGNLFRVNMECSETLSKLFSQVDQNEAIKNANRELYDSCLFSNLEFTSDLLEEYPKLQTREFLEDAGRHLQADFLVIYDSKGKELLSDSDYLGLSLEDAEGEERRLQSLLNGVSSVFREAIYDERIGSAPESFGVPMSLNDTGAYGALVAYMNPGLRENLGNISSNTLVEIAASNTRLLFSVDQESLKVIDSTNKDLIGRNVTELGMSNKSVKDHFMGFFMLNDAHYYGISNSHGGILYYIAGNQNDVLADMFPTAFIATIVYLIFFIVIARMLLSDYREENIQWMISEKIADDDMITTSDGMKKHSVDVSQRWILLRKLRGKKSPEDVALIVGEAIVLTILIAGAVWYLVAAAEKNSATNLISYCIHGDWEKGFNLFALTKILLLLGIVLFGIFLSEVINFAVSRMMDTKAETIGRLMMNIIRYALIILFIYYSLDYLGFDTRTVLASIGLLGLAISIGAKDLVTDVIAGLSIVFEGEYQVGDIVEIGGFRGKVIEIGVRSTKLEGRGGNIKIISNRDVKNVLNMTRLNSWCTVELKISSEEPLEEMEEVFNAKLPEIGKQMPQIISGPVYKGVVAFDGRSRTVSIIAECRESDYHRVERELMRSLNVLCVENDIKLQ